MSRLPFLLLLSCCGHVLGQEVDHDYLNEIDLGAESALPLAVDPGMGGGGGQQLQCGKCVKEQCVSPENCAAGVALDRCGCCQVCARSEGQLCDVDRNKNSGELGICGENLVCAKRDDVPGSESICKCQVQKMVCSNDKTTYPTICALNEESAMRGAPDTKYNPRLTMEYWGPCEEAPSIVSPPEDSYGALGANLTLACEAHGFPAPTITWQFVSAKGETVWLPNDDQSVSVQMRGGPEPLMVTGWVQIMSLDPSYIGVYHCIAGNALGQVYAVANVGVYKNGDDL